MKFTPSYWFRATLLFVLLGIGSFWLSSLDYSKHLSSDVMDLLPVTEQSPELSTALRIMRDRESRLLYITLESTDGRVPTDATVSAFVDSLRASKQFKQVTVGRGPSNPEKIAEWVFAQRMNLLFPQWLADKKLQYASLKVTMPDVPPLDAWLAADAVRSINQFLETPESLALAETLPKDPLLLTTSLLRLQDTLQGESVADANTVAVLWAETKAPALSPEGQAPVFAVMDAARLTAMKTDSALVMNYIGVHRYGAESRTKITQEITWLNLLSLIAVGAVACVFVRRLTPLFHLVAIVALSMLGAWTVTTLFFNPVHVLALVLGSLLCGEAIDYGLHILLHRECPQDASYAQILRHIGLPLCMGASTTIIGFLALLFSGLPLLRQTGVFVASGLICALAGCWLYFPLWKRKTDWQRTWSGVVPQPRRAWVKWFLWLFLAGLSLGITNVHWLDDIRDLDIKHPELYEIQEKVNQHFGASGERTAYFSVGKSPLEARDNLETFQALRIKHGLLPLQSLDSVLPTARAWAEANAFRQEHADFPALLIRELAANDFDTALFANFEEQWKATATAPDTLNLLYREMNTQLDGPLGNLMHCDASGSWLLGMTPPDELQTLTPPAGSFPVSQLQTLNVIFTRYRESAAEISLISWALIALLMIVVFRWPTGLMMAAIPLGAILLAGGVLGWTSGAINLFHLLGFFLGFCISMDYTIFGILARRDGRIMPVSILSSAITTVAAFGVLSLSSVAAVRALGISASLVVTFAVLILYIMLPSRRSR
ncbi:MAG: MMPL family transporter [Verrucomicrobiota bacterium]|nr:MMPL family transporter [Verrucomicrobiota bacterium]